MGFCEQCGKELHEGARFCGGCGGAVPEDKAAEAAPPPQPPEPTSWLCPTCDSENPPDALYCSHCGARHLVACPAPTPAGAEADTAVMAPSAGGETAVQTAVTAPASEAAEEEPSSGGFVRTLRKPWVIALIALVVIAAIAVAVVLTVTKQSNDKQAATDFDSGAVAVVTPLASSVREVRKGLPQAVVTVSWSTKLTPAVSAAHALETQLTQAQGQVAQLQSQTAGQATTKAALTKAIQSLSAYAEGVAALPGFLNRLRPDQAQALHHAASDAQAACAQLHNVAPGLPVLMVGACGALPGAAHKATADAALRQFLTQVQNDILNQSANGRSDIISAVAGVQNMTENPDDAATTIESVQSNRQSLLDQLSAMNVPSDLRASKIFTSLQESLQHSIEADRYYAAWMHHVYEYYYAEPEGYLGNVPTDGNYDSAVSQSYQAGSAKSRFVHVYNPLASKFGLQHDWQAGEI
jgi:hypothetical protein